MLYSGIIKQMRRKFLQ